MDLMNGDFEVLRGVQALMNGFTRPWVVCGGWAVDLHLGRKTREHADIEIGVFRSDQEALRAHLGGFSFEKVVGGKKLPWAPSESLELPVHEAQAIKDGESLEVLLNEGGAGEWVYRRDPRVRRAGGKAILHAQGIPYLAPELALLYKAKHGRERDIADAVILLPQMGRDAKLWLHQALSATLGPEEPWTLRVRAQIAPVRVSAKAVIIRDGALLALVHQSQDDLWYSVPGGGQEFGETLDQAVARECMEEVSVRVKPLRPIFIRDYIGANHALAAEHSQVHQCEIAFECEIDAGQTASVGTVADTGQTGVAWLPLATLRTQPLFPKCFIDAILAYTSEPWHGARYLGDEN